MKRGIFLSDIHIPDNIPLGGVIKYVHDFSPHIIILGGDIVDAKGMHGIDSLPASAVNVAHYERDVKLSRQFIRTLFSNCPNDTKMVYLEGNHEERYRRLARKYPELFGDLFNFKRDGIPAEFMPRVTWVPYGDYESFYRIADTVFVHGNIYPDNHAKAYAVRHTPDKVIYGHLHHFQAYTTHRATPQMNPRYAVTAGCLTHMSPDWKKGEAHQWVNGFISFIYNDKTLIPTIHLIEKGMFSVGAKIYLY